MGIKEHEETYTRIIKEYFCDICGKEIQQKIACVQCNKLLCYSCVEEWQGSDDYPDAYCQRCWELGEPFRAEIENLKAQIEEIHDQWSNACKEHI